MFAALLLSLCLQPPVGGRVVAPYAPLGEYAGHWGIDFEAAPGTPVLAAGPGTVTFAGSVAGMLSVTVDHGGGLRSSVSYLSVVSVRAGAVVGTGTVLGRTGTAHGGESVHFSTRLAGGYLDPQTFLQCRFDIPAGLWLLPPPDVPPYARPGANRHPRRHVRPAPRRPSARR
ncbi:MAG TPA: M23 family metallopeptidase [Acidimicrobiia bacterium]|jgi:murein DD-endopeptidase MepM/ murein hydrolase activator NlpD